MKSAHGRLCSTHNFWHGAIGLGFGLSNVTPIGEQKCIYCFKLFDDLSDTDRLTTHDLLPAPAVQHNVRCLRYPALTPC